MNKKNRKKNKIIEWLETIKSRYCSIRNRISGFTGKYLNNMALQAGIIALFLELFIESMGHKSIFGGIVFLFTSPLVFLFNTLIIFTSLSIAWLFRRRIFVYSLVSLAWLAIGITNGIILMYRMTPFTTTDLGFFELGLSILPNYFSTAQTILICAAIVAVILIFVLIFIFAPKRKGKVNLKRNIAGIMITLLVMTGSTVAAVRTGVMATYFGNLWDAYYDYGVPYCFINTWLNRGISKPIGYSEEKVNDVLSQKDLEKQTSKTADKETIEKFPNIVLLQLESFIDPDEIKSLNHDGEVVPFFKELKKKYSSGYLTVPVVGGGTANTEFEIMSGMSVRFFGPGEYPYKSVLKDNVCETMAFEAKDLGMGAHIIHNHRGAFYNRNTVFPNLGYDTFTSLEYMNSVSKTPRNWSKDDVLTEEIKGALESTKTKDYVYAISVQGHGEYPRKKVIEDPQVTVSGDNMEQGLINAYEYYIQQINEMDQFVKHLTEELNEYDEDVVLVIYGDHLPALDMEDEDMKSGSTFNNQYVIWSNFEMEKIDRDIKTYQLTAYVQERIGMSQGTLTVYHQNNWDKPGKTYLNNLELLQYDMLYGKKYVYGEKSPFKKTDMHMGFKKIKINDILEVNGQYYIKGEGFTSYSKVSLDGEVLDTIYLSPTILKLLDKVNPADVGKLKVSQVEKNKEILSTTE